MLPLSDSTSVWASRLDLDQQGKFTRLIRHSSRCSDAGWVTINAALPNASSATEGSLSNSGSVPGRLQPGFVMLDFNSK